MFIPLALSFFFGVEMKHIDPAWLRVLPPLILTLAVPIFLAFRRMRSSGLVLELDFYSRASIPQFLGMFCNFIGLLICGCMLLLPLLPLGLSALAAPVWVLLGMSNMLAFGVGILLIEVIHLRWSKTFRPNKGATQE
jgi:hypothetical protein